MDDQFYLIYFLKIINILFLIGSIRISEKVFSELYMKKVYAEEDMPPSIYVFMTMFLIMHAAFVLILLIILFLTMLVFKEDSNTFAISSFLIQSYFADYIVSTVFFILLSIIIGTVMQKKKYFRYKQEGLRAIRAYQDILNKVAIFVYLLPYFMYI